MWLRAAVSSPLLYLQKNILNFNHGCWVYFGLNWLCNSECVIGAKLIFGMNYFCKTCNMICKINLWVEHISCIYLKHMFEVELPPVCYVVIIKMIIGLNDQDLYYLNKSYYLSLTYILRSCLGCDINLHKSYYIINSLCVITVWLFCN
jgi:hypothetical protein